MCPLLLESVGNLPVPHTPPRSWARGSPMSRRVRVLGTLLLTAAAVAYLVWKIDLGTTLDVLEETSSRVVRARRRDHGPDRAGAGPALGLAPRGARHRRAAAVAHARVLRRVRGRAGAADVARRGRGAGRRHRSATPWADGGRDGDGAARARSRRRGDRAPRRDRVPALDRPLRRERVPLAGGRVRLRDDRRRLPLLRPLRAAAPAPAAAAARARPRWRGRCRRSTKACTTSGAVRVCCPRSCS